MSGSSTPVRVSIVMPPVTALPYDDALDRWGTVTAAASGLAATGDVEPVVHARHSHVAGEVRRGGVVYRFHTGDSALARAVAGERPDVVHVHGLGWTRLVRRLRRVGRPIVLQHHGEPVFHGRARLGHRLVRRHVAGYMFTGASTGQAQPWIDAGVIDADARVFEVFEAASLLPAADPAADPVRLEGLPAILWVGRLIESKDPLGALDAFAAAAPRLPAAHLHLLATERALEPEVRQRIATLGEAGERVHVHDPVPHAAMAAWFGAAHIYFSTSRREGSSYALIEAVTCGCVPVVTDIPSHRVIAAGAGALFPTGDPAAAAEALVVVSEVAPGATGSASPMVVTWERVVGQLAGVYRSLQD